MPPGKYHCDYCDKQFQDTPQARKRHLQSIQHQRARALWYDSFKAETHGGLLLQPDGGLVKGVCHHFVRTGICKYGDSCRYSHPKQNVLNAAQNVGGASTAETAKPPVFLGNQLIGGSIIGGGGISWGNLPPSLRPSPDGGFPQVPFVDWG